MVRTRAVEWLSAISDDELHDHLPQLVQALKYESYHMSGLACLIIERCITNPRAAHQVYWSVSTQPTRRTPGVLVSTNPRAAAHTRSTDHCGQPERDVACVR